MSKSVFNVANLHKIRDLKEAFDETIASLVHDCRARPGLRKAREITIKVQIFPDESDPDDVLVKHFVRSKLPEKIISEYKMQSTTNDGLKFQPDSPLSPDQESFDFEE